MKGIRVFDRFGFNPAKSSRKRKEVRFSKNAEEWNHDLKLNDWTNNKSQRLTGYVLSAELIYILEQKIYTEDE